MNKKAKEIKLVCGHIRGAFTTKPGPGFYCSECKEKVESLGLLHK